MLKTRIVRALVIPLFLLIIPLAAGQAVEGWNWSPMDYVFAYVLWAGASFMYVLITDRLTGSAHRIAACIGVLAALALIWVNGAVGIIGSEDELPNLLYLAVPAIGLLGAGISRFKPKGLAYTAYAMAFIQLLVPVIAFVIWRPLFDERPGMAGVIMINAFFVFAFVFTGLLFRHANTLELSK